MNFFKLQSIMGWLLCHNFRLGVVENGPGGPAEDFQKQALKSLEQIEGAITAQKSKTDELVKNFDNLQKETKGAIEELTTAKNKINTSVDEFSQKLKKVNDALRNEVRMAFGDPVKRIQNNEELRVRLNVAVREAMDSSGDMRKLTGPMRKALGEDTSPGSTLINDALLNEIYDTLASYGAWNTFGVRRLGTKTTKLPIKTARPVAKWILTEGDTIADDTNKTGTTVSLTVEVLAVLLNVSLQLLQDSEFDVTADVMDDFAEAYAFALDKAALTNDGGSPDADNGGFTGIFVGGTTIGAAATHDSVADLTYADFISVLTGVDAAILNRPCRWWMHPQMLARIVGVKDGNGRPIFQTALESPNAGAIGGILGYPLTLAHAAPNTDGASAKIAAFGDPAAQVVGIRSDYVFEASDAHKWNTLQRSFRGWGRAGTKIRKATALGILTTAAS